jgi:hypothetical protein
MVADESEDILPRSPLAELLVHLREAVYGLSQVADVYARETPEGSLTAAGYEALQSGSARARQAVEHLDEWHRNYS